MTAVDFNRFADNETGSIGSEKGHDLRTIFRRTDPSQRNRGDGVIDHFRRGKYFVKWRVDGSRRNRVNANTMRRKFFGLRFCQRDQPGLGRGIRAGARATAQVRGDRTDYRAVLFVDAAGYKPWRWSDSD